MKKAVAHFMSHWPSLFSVTIVLSGALCGVTTYLILTGLTPITPTPTILYTLLVTNLIFVVSMLGLVIHRLYKLYQQRKQGQAGAQLHSHLVSLFAFIAIVPAILVAIFAFVTLDQGLDRWFGERTKAIINNS
ncbi:MAG: PAS domain-containing sensor histidine kinase, partial [Alphaproteobacteria bacterium]|nr:PAS domain-containing sensor histidine kinase [Alphaproteobacteria bacterium]